MRFIRRLRTFLSKKLHQRKPRQLAQYLHCSRLVNLWDHLFANYCTAEKSSSAEVSRITHAQASERRCIRAEAILFTLAAATLNYAIDVANGFATPAAMTALTLSILAFACGIGLSRSPRFIVSESLLTVVIGGCLALQFVLLAMAFPPMVRHTFADMSRYSGAICLAGLLSGSMLMARERIQRIIFWCLAVIFAATVCWLLLAGGTPRIDVFVYQKFGVHNLFNGINPYTVDYPNIHSQSETLRYYGPNFAHGNSLPYGYTYPPLILFLTAIGECLFGDFRIGHATALIAAAFFIARARPSQWSFTIVILFLFTPSAFFILYQAWVEPLSFLLLGVSGWCWFRARRFLPLALGLFFASKQYLMLVFPLALLLAPGPLNSRATIVFLGKVIATACVVSLPLALLDFPAFIHSTVLFHVRTPFRPDSMSYLIWFSERARRAFSVIIFALCFCVVVMSLRFFKRSYENFLIALIGTLFLFFAFNKQAFANYYYFLVSAIWLLVAVVVGDVKRISATSSIHASSRSISSLPTKPRLVTTV